jgi:hypothetical protein
MAIIPDSISCDFFQSKISTQRLPLLPKAEAEAFSDDNLKLPREFLCECAALVLIYDHNAHTTSWNALRG